MRLARLLIELNASWVRVRSRSARTACCSVLRDPVRGRSAGVTRTPQHHDPSGSGPTREVPWKLH